MRFPRPTHPVVLCRSRRQAEAAWTRLAGLLAELGLELNTAKTGIVHLTEGGVGFDFLGFHHRWVRSRGRRGMRGVLFLARWPKDGAMRHARDRIRELTDRSRLLLPTGVIVEDVNRFLTGWKEYFRYGNSALRFDKIRDFALRRVAGIVAKRHGKSRGFGWSVVRRSSDQLGLISLVGTVVAPRPFRAWRGG